MSGEINFLDELKKNQCFQTSGRNVIYAKKNCDYICMYMIHILAEKSSVMPEVN